MKRLLTLAVAFLAGCASKAPPPLAVPPDHLMRHAVQSTDTLAADAEAARDAADRYIFGAGSTADGIETVRGLVGHMEAAVALARRHPSASHVEAAHQAVAAVWGWLAGRR